MSHQVIIAPMAVQQLQHAANWYRERSHSDELARVWLDGFLDVLKSQQFDPERYPLARECHRFPVSIREVHYGSGRRKTHRALFQVQRQTVHVLTVRHIAQDDYNPAAI
jgi:ParE toxin of type II toxin-antitoxin system, parDE